MSFISSWAQGIIVAVIIATIIEMLLPSNGNGKYVKMVVGVFVLFSIISPIISKFKGNDDSSSIDFDSYVETSTDNTTQTSSMELNNDEAIKKMYEENLKIDIKSKLSQRGYIVGEINLGISDNEEYTLNKIEVTITEKNEESGQNGNSQNTTTIVENIENVKVSLGGSSKDEEQKEESVINETEKRRLREYLSSVYEVKENNILVN